MEPGAVQILLPGHLAEPENQYAPFAPLAVYTNFSSVSFNECLGDGHPGQNRGVKTLCKLFP